MRAARKRFEGSAHRHGQTEIDGGPVDDDGDFAGADFSGRRMTISFDIAVIVETGSLNVRCRLWAVLAKPYTLLRDGRTCFQ